LSYLGPGRDPAAVTVDHRPDYESIDERAVRTAPGPGLETIHQAGDTTIQIKTAQAAGEIQ